MTIETDKPVILVFGRICSGKGTVCEPLSKLGYHHITTSDVVRHLSGARTRDKLQHTKDFDVAIGEEMVNIIREHQMVAIDGIRQTTIIDRIVEEFSLKYIHMVWIEVPENIRRERFLNRGAAKDDQTFEDAEAGDKNLGIDEVEHKYKNNCQIIHNY